MMELTSHDAGHPHHVGITGKGPSPEHKVAGAEVTQGRTVVEQSTYSAPT